MDVVCDKCSTKIKIPDQKIQKIPKGQVFNIACPKCKNKIAVKNEPNAGAKGPAKSAPGKPAPAKSAPAKPAPSPKPQQGQGTDEDDASSGNPFEFLEEGAKTAMICEMDSGIRGKIRVALKEANYHLSEPDSHREALKQMRFHDFGLLVINETFGTRDPDMNHVLKHLEQLPMITRREMFIAMLTGRFRTMDRMMAFNKSVNIVINLKDIDDVGQIIERGIKDNDLFYRVFKESLKKFKG